jgi:hypothetical protein
LQDGKGEEDEGEYGIEKNFVAYLFNVPKALVH